MKKKYCVPCAKILNALADDFCDTPLTISGNASLVDDPTTPSNGMGDNSGTAEDIGLD